MSKRDDILACLAYTSYPTHEYSFPDFGLMRILAGENFPLETIQASVRRR